MLPFLSALPSCLHVIPSPQNIPRHGIPHALSPSRTRVCAVIAPEVTSPMHSKQATPNRSQRRIQPNTLIQTRAHTSNHKHMHNQAHTRAPQACMDKEFASESHGFTTRGDGTNAETAKCITLAIESALKWFKVHLA